MSQCVGWVRWATVSGALLAGHAVVSAAPAIAEDAAGQAPPLAAAASEAADNAEAAAQAQAAYQQALQALEQQQWTQAELLLERVLMFQPEHAEALLQLPPERVGRQRGQLLPVAGGHQLLQLGAVLDQAVVDQALAEFEPVPAAVLQQFADAHLQVEIGLVQGERKIGGVVHAGVLVRGEEGMGGRWRAPRKQR